MTRELYGVGSLVGREKFGLGSSLKKFVRKIIPNEVADIAVKAAPFVAPFNPAIGGAMAALGSFDQTGSIGKSVQRGLINYGLGQGARYLGGAQLQGNPFQGPMFSSPIGVERTGLGTFLRGPEVAADAYVPTSTVTASTAEAPFGNLIEANAQMNISNLPAETVAPGWRESVSKLTSGDFTKMGEGLKELGGDALKAIYTKPGEGGKPVVDKFAVAATIAGVSTFMDAKNLATEAGLVDNPEEYTEEMYNADKARYLEQYSKALPASAFGLKKGGRVGYQEGGTDTVINADDLNLFQEGFPKYYDEEGSEISFEEFEAGMKEPVMPRRKPKEMVEKNKLEKLLELKNNMEPEAFEMYLEKLKDELGGSGVPSIFLKEKKAYGGRIGFFEGSPDDPQGRRKGIVSINPMQEDLEEAGIGTMAASPFTAAEKTFLFKFLAGKGGKERTFTMPDLYKIFKNPGKYPKDEQVLKGVIEMKMGKKEGGRIGYSMGSEVPIRKNQGGISELDYRNTGGFVPIGVKEKADDVPAMLSKNEFVFTADAVRAAGGGSINTGAQRMYNLMKQLENKAV